MPASDQSGRIAVFAALAVLAFFAAIPASMWLARPPMDVTQAERLGAELGCTCGTCPHRPMATCGCGFADGMLARLDVEVAAGRTDAEITAIFVAEYGNGVKIKPEGSGFDLLAWVAPIALLMVGAVAMAGVISQWRAGSDAEVPAFAREATAPKATSGKSEASGTGSSRPPDATDSDRYRSIVERELEAFDD